MESQTNSFTEISIAFGDWISYEIEFRGLLFRNNADARFNVNSLVDNVIDFALAGFPIVRASKPRENRFH